MLSDWWMPGCEWRSDASKCLKEGLYDLYFLYCIVFLRRDYVNRCEKKMSCLLGKKYSATLNTDSVCLLVFSWDLSHTFCCICCVCVREHLSIHALTDKLIWVLSFLFWNLWKKKKRKRGEWTEKRDMGFLSLPINQRWREILKALTIACTMISP